MSINLPTLEELKMLIIDSLRLEGMSPDAIGDADPLFGDGLGLDSVDALELIVAMEKRFKVKIRSDEIAPETFRSVSSMHRFIHQQIARTSGTPQ